MRFFAPIPADDRPRRMIQLFGGLLVYGISSALLIEAVLGIGPWDGVTERIASTSSLRITGSDTESASMEIGPRIPSSHSIRPGSRRKRQCDGRCQSSRQLRRWSRLSD